MLTLSKKVLSASTRCDFMQSLSLNHIRIFFRNIVRSIEYFSATNYNGEVLDFYKGSIRK